MVQTGRGWPSCTIAGPNAPCMSIRGELRSLHGTGLELNKCSLFMSAQPAPLIRVSLCDFECSGVTLQVNLCRPSRASRSTTSRLLVPGNSATYAKRVLLVLLPSLVDRANLCIRAVAPPYHLRSFACAPVGTSSRCVLSGECALLAVLCKSRHNKSLLHC